MRTRPRAPASDAQAQKQAGVLKLVTAYRSRGHLAAQLDPLDLEHTFPPSDLEALGLLPRPAAPDLDPAFHGLTSADLDTDFDRLARRSAALEAPRSRRAAEGDLREHDRRRVHAHLRRRAAALGA